MLRAVQNSLLSLVYPQECRVCRSETQSKEDGVACGKCWNATRILEGSEMLCDKCGVFFGDEAIRAALYCHKCDNHLYDKASAAGIYEKALAASIIDLKTTPRLPLRVKAILQTTLQRSHIASADVILPVPLSKQRRLERGFNQAEIIADTLSVILGVPVDTLSLGRRLHTPIHRIGMDNKARELTVRNAFEVVRPNLIAGKTILLTDDVFTSGATASACAKVLKKNGAGRVNVFTLARAVMD